jgi:thiol-disulfide isomerase/thioredoxin
MKGLLRGCRVLIAVAVVAWSLTAHTAHAQGLPIGTRAPAVTIQNLNGELVDLGTMIGKRPILLEFWATWCPLCEVLLPKLRAAAEAYGDRVTFIGVNVTVSQTKGQVKRYLDEHRPPFVTLWDDEGELVRAYDVLGTSLITIIDSEGIVAYSGYGAEQDIIAALRKTVGP